jgi:hypothetical protein
MGWHLWGTELCLQSKNKSNEYKAKIIDVPLFHNSINDFILPEDFLKSLNKLYLKYPNTKSIDTLCGTFSITD